MYQILYDGPRDLKSLNENNVKAQTAVEVCKSQQATVWFTTNVHCTDVSYSIMSPLFGRTAFTLYINQHSWFISLQTNHEVCSWLTQGLFLTYPWFVWEKQTRDIGLHLTLSQPLCDLFPGPAKEEHTACSHSLIRAMAYCGMKTRP